MQQVEVSACLYFPFASSALYTFSEKLAHIECTRICVCERDRLFVSGEQRLNF